MNTLNGILDGNSVRHWETTRKVLVVGWPLFFIPWLIVSARFIFKNIVPQLHGSANLYARIVIFHNVGVAALLLVTGIAIGVNTAPNTLGILGITPQALVLYLWVLLAPLVWWGSRRYINLFLPAYEHNVQIRIYVWLYAVSGLSGIWLGCFLYVF